MSCKMPHLGGDALNCAIRYFNFTLRGFNVFKLRRTRDNASPYPKTKTVYWVVFTREMKFKIEKKVPDYRTS